MVGMSKALPQDSIAPALGNSTPLTHPANKRPTIRRTFAALQHRNYRLWFFGQMVSLAGTWVQTTAQGYLIYQLTHSPAYLGLVAFAAGIPAWLFTLYGGVVADRMSRRNLLVITQTTMMLLAFILAGLASTGLIQAWHILVLATLLGIANAFDAPARVSFVAELVPREDLTNAIALNATMFNTATAVGPAVGGLLYAALGPAWCFTINGISFLAVIVALLMMRITLTDTHLPQRSALADAAAGISYVRTSVIVRTVIGYLGMVSLFGISFVALMPAWAVKVLGGDAATNGFLQSARGVGAIAGALMLAAIGSYTRRGKLVTLGSLVMPLVLLVFTAMRWLPLSLLTLVGVGWGFLLFANSANALVQNVVPDELRGRVMSIYTLAFFGLMPIGSLLAGAVATGIGEPLTVAIGALILLVFSGWVWVKVPELRRAG
jgi:MFS family permease